MSNSMRISTQQLYSQLSDAMSRSAGDLAKLQAQISSGTKFTRASEAPDLSARVQFLNSRIEALNTDRRSIESVRIGVAAQADALQSGTDHLARIHSLAIQAASDTYTNADRQAIAAEIATLRKSLLDLANSKDAEGRYVFAGTSSSRVPYLSDGGGTTYTGSRSPLRVRINDEGYEDATVSGPEMWGHVRRLDPSTQSVDVIDSFSVLTDLENAIENGDRDKMQQGLDEVGMLEHALVRSLAKIGGTQARLTDAAGQVDTTILQAKQTLSEVQDLDYAEAMSRLQKQEVLLQASQAMLGKLSSLSLLDVLR
jgi:flagellar hook-associated protein 3 FlgL